MRSSSCWHGAACGSPLLFQRLRWLHETFGPLPEVTYRKSVRLLMDHMRAKPGLAATSPGLLLASPEAGPAGPPDDAGSSVAKK